MKLKLSLKLGSFSELSQLHSWCSSLKIYFFTSCCSGTKGHLSLSLDSKLSFSALSWQGLLVDLPCFEEAIFAKLVSRANLEKSQKNRRSAFSRYHWVFSQLRFLTFAFSGLLPLVHDLQKASFFDQEASVSLEGPFEYLSNSSFSFDF